MLRLNEASGSHRVLPSMRQSQEFMESTELCMCPTSSATFACNHLGVRAMSELRQKPCTSSPACQTVKRQGEIMACCFMPAFMVSYGCDNGLLAMHHQDLLHAKTYCHASASCCLPAVQSDDAEVIGNCSSDSLAWDRSARRSEGKLHAAGYAVELRS